MGKRKDLKGQIFGRLKVTNYSHTNKNNRACWFVKCSCGKELTVSSKALTTRNTKSCGCLLIDTTRELKTKHGCTTNKAKSSEYIAWSNMIARCSNPQLPNYKNYGGRGIKVCERWSLSFENFLHDMGQKPSDKHSIERLNNEGGYEPCNCIWAFQSRQNANKRLPSTNKSGYLGVAFLERLNKWRATVTVNSKSIHIGLYMTKEECVVGRNNYLIRNDLVSKGYRLQEYRG